jgi:hypothetical protein
MKRTSLHRVLQTPLFGTTVVHPSARVDGSQFPEDEFPVRCPKCAYELRGLPEPRCPECGEPFDRGRLLVVQYATRPTNRPITSRDQKMLLWLAVFALITMVVSYVLPPVILGTASTTTRPGVPANRNLASAVDRLAWLSTITSAVQITAFLALIATVLWIVYKFRRDAARRQRVVQAIRQSAAQEMADDK